MEGWSKETVYGRASSADSKEKGFSDGRIYQLSEQQRVHRQGWGAPGRNDEGGAGEDATATVSADPDPGDTSRPGSLGGGSLGRSCGRASGTAPMGVGGSVLALCTGSSLSSQWFSKTLTPASFSSLPTPCPLLPSSLLLFLRVILSILWFKPLLRAVVLHSQLLVIHPPVAVPRCEVSRWTSHLSWAPHHG